jgi:hypothetical protein
VTVRDWLILAALLGLYMFGAATTPRPELLIRTNPYRTSSSATASWYCGNGSPCTAGYGPSDLVAAIDRSTGFERGERVTVRHDGRSVTVLIVDICLCGGARVIDLTSGAFMALSPDQSDEGRAAFLRWGVIDVTLDAGGPRVTPPATDTAP